jgi:DNA-binding winged helix-turn-helix (wHTH) protein
MGFALGAASAEEAMPDLAEPAICRFNDFLLDKREGLFRLHPDGGKTPIQVGSRALRILCLLADRRGETVSQREIMDMVWPNLSVEPNNLTVQISALRRALDADRGQGSCIQNVPGRGYRFVPTVTETDRPLGDQAANTQTKAILAPDGVAGTADAFDTLAGQPEPLPAQEPAVPHRTLRAAPSLGPSLRASPSRFWRRPLSGMKVARRYPSPGRLPHTHRRS